MMNYIINGNGNDWYLGCSRQPLIALAKLVFGLSFGIGRTGNWRTSRQSGTLDLEGLILDPKLNLVKRIE
jgi:hypothetical protein